jgi:hypothetical protein
MDPLQYKQRLDFLLSQGKTVPDTLHLDKRKNWKRATKKQYLVGWLTSSTFHEPYLQVLRKITGPLGDKAVVPKAVPTKDTIQTLLLETHTKFGHFGRDKMMLHLNESWYWKGMKKDVTLFLADCEHCLRVKPDNKRPPLRPILATKRRERAMYDLTYMHEDPNTGEKYILVVIDIFTKFIWTKGLTTKKKGGVIRYLEDCFRTEPFHIWQSDNGGEFKNKRLTKALNQMGGQIVHGRPYHPQSQGHVERVNGTLKLRLKSLLPHETAPWSDLLAEATWAYNTSIHSVIKMTPYLAEFGEMPNTPTAMPSDPHLRKLYNSMNSNKVKEYSREALDQVLIKREKEAADRRMALYNKNARTVLYSIGEIVRVRKQIVSKRAKKNKHFDWQAIISAKSDGTSNCYKVCWIGDGPTETDKHGTESAFLATNLLRKEGPKVAAALALKYSASEEFGGLFAQFDRAIPAVEQIPPIAEQIPPMVDQIPRPPKKTRATKQKPHPRSDSEEEIDSDELEESSESEIDSGVSSSEEEDEFDESQSEEESVKVTEKRKGYYYQCIQGSHNRLPANYAFEQDLAWRLNDATCPEELGWQFVEHGAAPDPVRAALFSYPLPGAVISAEPNAHLEGSIQTPIVRVHTTCTTATHGLSATSNAATQSNAITCCATAATHTAVTTATTHTAVTTATRTAATTAATAATTAATAATAATRTAVTRTAVTTATHAAATTCTPATRGIAATTCTATPIATIIHPAAPAVINSLRAVSQKVSVSPRSQSFLLAQVEQESTETLNTRVTRRRKYDMLSN